MTLALKTQIPFEFDYSDSTCQKQIEKAKNDIEKGEYSYITYHFFDDRLVYENEIEELLQKQNIKYKPLGENCTSELNCYVYYMDSVIKVKFGLHYIDSILTQAKELSESKWKTKVYSYFEIDKKAFYIDSNDERYFDKYLKSKIQFPKDWYISPRHASIRQYALLTVIVGNNGKAIIKPGSLEISLDNRNKKFKERIVSEIKNGFNSMDLWTPAKLNGHNVSSKLYVDIDLDNP